MMICKNILEALMNPINDAPAQPISASADSRRQVNLTFLTFLSCALLFLLMQASYATVVHTPMGDVLCTIVRMVYGNLGRGLASLAVIIIGVGATLGKTSWGLAMTVAVGIAVIFNAHTIVGTLGGGQYAAGCIFS